MKQIINPPADSSQFKNRNYAEKNFSVKEDSQKIVNLFGKAIDDLEISLFQMGNSVPTFSETTAEEKELIQQTKIKAAYIVLAINKELELMEFDIMEALEKNKIKDKLLEIKEQILNGKTKKVDPIKSLAIENMNFLHQVFGRRFDNNLKEINEASKKAMAN